MNLSGAKLSRSFYNRPTLTVARELLRKTIVYHHPDGIIAGDIVEVEAYIGQDDPACHAAVGKTERNSVMFGPGGFSYIYFIYGMYHCFNIVTEEKNNPAAVLVRGVEPVNGIEILKNSSPENCQKCTNGPGKFCRAFGLTREQNGFDLTGEKLYIIDRGKHVINMKSSPRIGIKNGRGKLWRFFDGDSEFVSR
ncbi:MAG: DNA-3-methyladenine glycosylase [candidate division Zixibacteria bacterium]